LAPGAVLDSVAVRFGVRKLEVIGANSQTIAEYAIKRRFQSNRAQRYIRLHM
jgi:hypothetical protein